MRNCRSSDLPICSLSVRTSWKSSALSTSILPWHLASSSSDGCNRQSVSHTASSPRHHAASSTMRSSKSSTLKTTFSDIASTSSCNPRTNYGVLFVWTAQWTPQFLPGATAAEGVMLNTTPTVKDETSCTLVPPTCLHGMEGDNSLIIIGAAIAQSV